MEATESLQTVCETEIMQRLDKMAFHFEETASTREAFPTCSRQDYHQDPMKCEAVKRVYRRLFSEIDSLLSEEVHLIDNLQRYYDILNRKKRELDVIKEFRAYKIAANYINTLKHGTPGDQLATKADLTYMFFDQRGSEPKPDDTIIDMKAVLNFDGEPFASDDVAESLIRFITLFLDFHLPDFNIREFKVRIAKVLNRNASLSQYSAKIPDGILHMLKKTSAERKLLKGMHIEIQRRPDER